MKRYTAQEMRDMAEQILHTDDDWYEDAGHMLLQAADMMDRESTSEKSAAVGNAAAMLRQAADEVERLRAENAQLNKDSVCRDRVIRGLKQTIRFLCQKRDDQARALEMKSKAMHIFYLLATLQQIDLLEIGDRLEVIFGQTDGTFSPPGVTEIYNIARKPRVGGLDGCKLYPHASTIKESLEVADKNEVQK